VLKLVYHSPAFGAIDLEYDRAVIRVGSSEDNDLVLLHPSIGAHHCTLIFQGEKVLYLPPSDTTAWQTELGSSAGSEFGLGETLSIGAMQFILAHSSKTIAVPEVRSQVPAPISPAAGPGTIQRRYYCPHCRAFFPEGQVKRVGLVGKAKRCLCPRCSSLLEPELEAKPETSQP
jgi:hypothetical protein